MKFISATGDVPPEQTVIAAIRAFDSNGESGPHSCEGWILSQILTYCTKNDIPFSLVYIPQKGYYVKRGIVDDVMPAPIRKTLEAHA